MAEFVAQRPAAAARPEQQRTGSAQRDDSDHGVGGGAAPYGVPVPGDTVSAVPVEAEPRGAERLAKLALGSAR